MYKKTEEIVNYLAKINYKYNNKGRKKMQSGIIKKWLLKF